MVFNFRQWRVLSDRDQAARSRRHGAIGIIVIVSVLCTTGLAYVNPIGRSHYTAHASMSGGVRSGDEVRIAGVGVGQVASVRLDGTVVRIEFDVDRSVPVGDQSTLDVKMLTALGGHYVALDPRGALPLGDNVIPPHRVKLPFESTDLIQEVTPFVKQVDGQVLHDTFTEVAAAVNTYPDALRDVVRAANQLTGLLRNQTGEVHRGVDFVNHALGAAVGSRAKLGALVEQFALVGQRYTTKSVDIIEFFTLLRELTRIIDRAIVFYGREVAPLVSGIDDIIAAVTAHPDRIGQAFDGLGQILNVIAPALNGTGAVFDASHRPPPGPQVCLPTLTRQC